MITIRQKVGAFVRRCTDAILNQESSSGLTFNILREANLIRLPLFKNARGEIAHSMKDGSDWSISDWVMAIVGELGELSNIFKKIKRGDYTQEEQQVEIAKELADVCTYLDILALQCGVNLGEAIIAKFNEVSDRVHVDVKIDDTGSYVYRGSK